VPARQAVMAYRLIYDYTVGFALGDRATAGEQRLRNAQTSRHLRPFLRPLPADLFPVLAAIGEQVWTSDRDERFTASMSTIIKRLLLPAQAARRVPSTCDAKALAALRASACSLADMRGQWIRATAG
jgi:hypothetical protein